jgi:2-oxoglutarate dehydrogenase E2 component (dihydrolipoamide succinyltransferase)
MSFEVKIPSVGESITTGLLSVWHKNEGDLVGIGDALLTLETDKVSSEITAEQPGVLHIKVPAGTDVKIGEVVATIEEAGAGAAGPVEKPMPAGGKMDKDREGEGKRRTMPAPTVGSEPPPPDSAPAPSPGPKPDVVSEAGPAPVTTPGAAVAAANEALSVVSENIPAATREGRTTRKRLSPLRRKIAQQLVMAQHTAAILTTFNEADMSAIMKLRGEMQEAFTQQHGVKLGFMSFFIKAAVSALKAVPAVNGRMDGDDYIQNHFYDVGVAVGTERGLVVPVIRDADQLSFADIERQLAEYAGKAREGKIKIEDLQGGVFTISNGGIYGSLLSTPILNPPQSGILGMHKIQERPVAEKGQVVVRPMMYLALSYDHRVVDGKEAVTFLVRVKECIESPARLLLGL